MSVKVMGLVWDLDRLSRDEKYLLLAYADHADHSGRNIYPAVATIARKTGYSIRAVQLITRMLQKHGYLLEDGSGPNGTNKWRIPVLGGEIIAGANFAPLQESTGRGAKNEGGGAKTIEGGAIAIAPEPSFKPSFKPSLTVDAKTKKIFDAFENVVEIYCRDIPKHAQDYLASCRANDWNENDQTLKIICDKPDWLQQRAKKSLERLLVGIIPDREIKLEFVSGGGAL